MASHLDLNPHICLGKSRESLEQLCGELRGMVAAS